jgi:hypothetical protein
MKSLPPRPKGVPPVVEQTQGCFDLLAGSGVREQTSSDELTLVSAQLR